MVVQLHNHSHYSVLDGRSRISEIIDRVKELGQNAVALTDHGVMYGAIEFYRAAVANGVKPIIGVEAYVARESRLRKDPHADKMGSSWHLTLLAMNAVGYQNLLRLTSAAHVEGFYFRPRIDFDLLKKYSEGIFVLSGCMSGQVSDMILSGNLLAARKVVADYRDLLGDRYAIEVHNHEHPKQKDLNTALFELAKDTGIRLVAACDSHYVRPEDAESHDAMLAIQTGSTLTDPSRFKVTPYGAYYLRSHQEMLTLFRGQEHAVQNTEWVAEQCNLTLDFSKVMLPEFPIPDGYTPISWLRTQVYDGLRWRYGTIGDIYKNRVDYELSVIDKTGYALYFLIVQDYVKHARRQGVMAVPRGSVAGSLCIYALGICDIDPVKYDIMFERFLNDERKGMPDIDMDFADDSRDDVIRYVTERYGSNRVAHIGTFQTMGAKAAVKDVARVKGIDFATSNAFTKLFPDKPDVTLSSLDDNPRIQDALKASPQLSDVLRLAKELEGLTRGFGTHAAGMLIAATDLHDVVPVQLPPEKGSKKSAATVVTQYDNNNQTAIIESIGLSKFDFLGLANLSIIRDVCALIKSRHNIDLYGESGELLYSDLPLDYSNSYARRAYDLLASGETTAVFQTESPGMRRVLRLVQPTKVSDIAAIVALYRPGPMEYVPVFADAKHGRTAISYLHPDLKPILEETYGVVVYQDQVLLIARKIAGFSWGEVDTLRKGMGKKILSIIDEQRQKFLTRSVANGYSKEVAVQIWEQIEPFAGYGFNRAHAVCYGYVSFITAYLKANYPVEYMTSVLTHESNNKEKISEAIQECRRMGIPVLPPSVNISSSNFSIATLDDIPTIVFGLSAVTGMGASACRTIIENRERSGIFTSFPNFLSRVNLDALNQRGIGSLIKAGALDDFGERKNLLFNLVSLLESNRTIATLRSLGQTDMFSSLGLKEITMMPNEVPPMTRKERLDGEFEVLGVYISEHPLDDVRDQLEQFCTHDSSMLEGQDGQECILGGIITRIRHHSQKDGKPMAFITLQDYQGQIDALVFARTFEKVKDMLVEETRVIVRGSVTERTGQPSVRIDDIVALNPVASSFSSEPPPAELSWVLAPQKVPSRIGRLWKLFDASSPDKSKALVHLATNKGSIKFEVHVDAEEAVSILR